MEGKIYFVIIPIIVGALFLAGTKMFFWGLRHKKNTVVIIGIALGIFPLLYAYFSDTIHYFFRSHRDLTGEYKVKGMAAISGDSIFIFEKKLPPSASFILSKDGIFVFTNNGKQALEGEWKKNDEGELLQLSLPGNAQQVSLSTESNEDELELEDEHGRTWVLAKVD